MKIEATRYPLLAKYTSAVRFAQRPIIGRDREMNSILSAFERPELCNVILLGDPGVGKSAVVQGLAKKDFMRSYLEVDLARMVSDLKNPDELAGQLKKIFAETTEYVSELQLQDATVVQKQLVLFIDEFHLVTQLSKAAVEALKPLLADSGTRNIRVIGATTYEEFRTYISSNLPLVERLQRINMLQTDKATTISILRDMAIKYNVASSFYTDHVFEMIYEYTNRYIPASSQPRKSILILDAMIGYHRHSGKPLDVKLLADVIYESENVNVAVRVDAMSIKNKLNQRVLAQPLAMKAIEERLQICTADLNSPDKPMASMLFSGSTGSGKALPDYSDTPIYKTANGATNIFMKKHGELEPDDWVFNKDGKPVRVMERFPQGELQIYEVELVDGRVILCSGEHLWTYKSRFGNGSKYWKNATTEELRKKMENVYVPKGRNEAHIKFCIPMNQPVEFEEIPYRTDPYIIGALIGNGTFRSEALEISSGCDFVPKEIAHLLGLPENYATKQNSSYTYQFYEKNIEKKGRGYSRVQLNEIIQEVPELFNLYSYEKFIPRIYKYGSIAQRWSLIQGLFDTDGSIQNTDRHNVSFSTSSEQLAYDVQDMLYSLGISSTIHRYDRKDKVRRDGTYSIEYDLHIKCDDYNKKKFFRLPRKLELALRAQASTKDKKRVKKFDQTIGIRAIRKTDEFAPMSCILVDDPDHLYQVGQYVVTHNTETAKALADILFQDEKNLIRFDMSEYAREESMGRFQKELTRRIWERPYSILLLDEIEKACGSVTRLLLQVLDDGRLSDENGREVSFTNTYIIMTTNAGSEVYKTIGHYAKDSDDTGRVLKDYLPVIRNSITKTAGDNKFPPELLGRINCLVPFQPLSLDTQREIVVRKIKKLKEEVLVKHGVILEVDKKVLVYLVDNHMSEESDAGGARAAVSRFEEDLVALVARKINESSDKRRLRVAVDGVMRVEDKGVLEDSARLVAQVM